MTVVEDLLVNGSGYALTSPHVGLEHGLLAGTYPPAAVQTDVVSK